MNGKVYVVVNHLDWVRGYYVKRGFKMFDLELVKKVNEVEKKTGESMANILGNVPFSNVVTSFKVIPVSDLVDMVMGVSISTLVEGLTIITPKQISNIPVDKLKVVLFSGNMQLVGDLQDKYGEDRIIEALSKMSVRQVETILSEGNFSSVCSAIDNVLGIIEG